MRRLLFTLAVLAAAPQAPHPPGVRITTRPRVPRQGSLVQLRVTPPADDDSVVAVSGELAGEPLHFEPSPRRGGGGGDGGFRALGGVPLDAPDTIAVRLELHQASGVVDTEVVSLPVARRRAVVDRVTTAPRFAEEPDSAVTARIMAERELTRRVSRGAHDIPRLWVKPFVRPRPRASRVTSPFGARREVNGVLGGRHPGVDVAGPAGAPVRAANRGVVALVGDFFFGGISVYVYHGAGLLTAYHHLSSAAVAIGDTVEHAEVIGRVGATGRVTGPHLHWGAQYGRHSVDPADLLTLLAAGPD
jgi:murein DD-endopeptidase MepM/ murein hydrolase activator NlpD